MVAEVSGQHGPEQLPGLCAIPVRAHVPGVLLEWPFDQGANCSGRPTRLVTVGWNGDQ
jgi:hypothetical protein